LRKKKNIFPNLQLVGGGGSLAPSEHPIFKAKIQTLVFGGEKQNSENTIL